MKNDFEPLRVFRGMCDRVWPCVCMHVCMCMYVCVRVHVCTRFGTYMCNSSVSFEVRCWGTICIHTIHAGGPYGCLYAYLYAYLYVPCDCVENIYGLAGICTPTHTHTHTHDQLADIHTRLNFICTPITDTPLPHSEP